MSEFDFYDIDSEYADARIRLHEALENVDYLNYAVEEGPLTLGQVEQDRRISDSIIDVMGRFGWPSSSEDGVIESTSDYGSSLDFLESMKPLDKDGLRYISSDHFYILVSQPIIHTFEEARTGSSNGVYGMSPFLHRAHAVAPDLFGSLRKSLQKLTERYGGISDTDNVYEELLKEQNSDIVEGLYMAYHILGRLIKVNDFDMLGSPERSVDVPTPILNADVALRVGDIATGR